jgi:hypothetical protein
MVITYLMIIYMLKRAKNLKILYFVSQVLNLTKLVSFRHFCFSVKSSLTSITESLGYNACLVSVSYWELRVRPYTVAITHFPGCLLASMFYNVFLKEYDNISA